MKLLIIIKVFFIVISWTDSIDAYSLKMNISLNDIIYLKFENYENKYAFWTSILRAFIKILISNY